MIRRADLPPTSGWTQPLPPSRAAAVRRRVNGQPLLRLVLAALLAVVVLAGAGALLSAV